MRRLFVEPATLAADPVVVSGPDHHHLANVLRAKVGDRLHLLDGVGASWECEVRDVDRKHVELLRIEPLPPPPEPARRIVLAQALGKGDRFEEAIQHATEAGAAAFIPLVTERGTRRLDLADLERKSARWRGVLKGAAEQSGRASVPVLLRPATPPEAAARYTPGAALMLHGEGAPAAAAFVRLAPDAEVVLLVGPEGGFTDTEVASVVAAGGQPISLGPFVLRTETAGVVAVALALFAASSASAVLESGPTQA